MERSVAKDNDNFEQKPLVLIATGLPGAGKTAAFKTAASRLLERNVDIGKHVIIATPTGSTAAEMGYGARTIHSAFSIPVGKKFKNIDKSKLSTRDLEFIVPGGRKPEDIFLVIFDGSL